MPVTFHDFARRAAPTRNAPIGRSSGKPRASGDVSQWSEARARGRAWLEERTTGRGRRGGQPGPITRTELPPVPVESVATCQIGKPFGKQGCDLLFGWAEYAVCNYYQKMVNAYEWPVTPVGVFVPGQTADREELTIAAIFLELVLRRFGEICGAMNGDEPITIGPAPYATTPLVRYGPPYTSDFSDQEEQWNPLGTEYPWRFLLSIALQDSDQSGYTLVGPAVYDYVTSPPGNQMDAWPIKNQLKSFFDLVQSPDDVDQFYHPGGSGGPATGCWLDPSIVTRRLRLCHWLEELRKKSRDLINKRLLKIPAGPLLKEKMKGDFWYSKVAACRTCTNEAASPATAATTCPQGCTNDIGWAADWDLGDGTTYPHKTLIEVLIADTAVDLGDGKKSTVLDCLCAVCCQLPDGSVQSVLSSVCLADGGTVLWGDAANACKELVCCLQDGQPSMVAAAACPAGSKVDIEECTVCCVDQNGLMSKVPQHLCTAPADAHPVSWCDQLVCCSGPNNSVVEVAAMECNDLLPHYLCTNPVCCAQPDGTTSEVPAAKCLPGAMLPPDDCVKHTFPNFEFELPEIPWWAFQQPEHTFPWVELDLSSNFSGWFPRFRRGPREEDLIPDHPKGWPWKVPPPIPPGSGAAAAGPGRDTRQAGGPDRRQRS